MKIGTNNEIIEVQMSIKLWKRERNAANATSERVIKKQGKCVLIRVCSNCVMRL